MAQDYDYAQLLDDFELGADVMPGEELTEYIERRRREFESKADGGSIGIEVLFKEKMANGGRVPMVSGGALKTAASGIMKLFGKGDDAVDLAKQEEIFRSGPITKEFLETVDSKVINPFVRTRDAKGVGSYGLYDNFDDMPAGLKAAEIIKRFVNRKTGEINYDAAEFFIGRKLKGDETINELIDIAISKPIGSGKSANLEELMADGGRVGLFMGGPALEGQALDIYTSMNKYGFSDQEIADALSARGLYTAAGNTTTTTPLTNTQTNIINQGGGGGGNGGGGITTFDKGFSSQNFGLGPNKDVVDYEAEAYGIGPTFKGQVARAFSALSNIPTPFNIARMGITKAINFAKQKAAEKKEKELQDFYNSTQAAITRDIARDNKAAGTGGYQAGYGGDFMGGGGRGRGNDPSDKGGSDSMGSFKRGGLATMFTRRR